MTKKYPDMIWADYDELIINDRYLVADTLSVGHGKVYYSENVIEKIIEKCFKDDRRKNDVIAIIGECYELAND